MYGFSENFLANITNNNFNSFSDSEDDDEMDSDFKFELSKGNWARASDF